MLVYDFVSCGVHQFPDRHEIVEKNEGVLVRHPLMVM